LDTPSYIESSQSLHLDSIADFILKLYVLSRR